MQLTEHRPGNHHVIRQVDQSGILIDDTRHVTSVILGARLLETDWPVADYGDLNEQTLAPLLRHEPEVVLLGFGHSQRFPPIEIQREFMARGIGLESMTLDAAARTFNVLMSENRRALAALILPKS